MMTEFGAPPVADILEVAARSSPYAWEVTRTGFAHLTILQTRVTVWHRDLIMDDSIIHNHPWDYQSTVVTGGLYEEIAQGVSEPCEGWAYTQHVHVNGAMIPLGFCWAKVIRRHTHARGTVYNRKSHTLHTVYPEDKSITLVQKGRRLHHPTILTREGDVRDAYDISLADKRLYQERTVDIVKQYVAQDSEHR